MSTRLPFLRGVTWRHDNHGSWYAVDRVASSGGLGVPVTDVLTCSCSRPGARPAGHAQRCEVRRGFEQLRRARRARHHVRRRT